MTTVRQAVSGLGITDTEVGSVVLAVYDSPSTQVPEHRSLDDIGDRDASDFHALYIASGLFRHGAIVNNKGRTNANVTQVNWLVLDCDLKDYVGLDAAELFGFDQRDLDDMITGQVATLSEIMHRIGVPMHRVIATGYGVAVHVRIRDGVGDAVALLPSVHKRLIGRINDLATYALVDPSASDAGARITRVPGSFNTKGDIPRPVRVLAEDRLSPSVTAAGLAAMLGAPVSPAPVLRSVIKADRALPGDMEAEIVAAVAPHWTLGHKHNLSLALSGMLAKAGVKQDQALRIMAALSAEDERPWDRSKSVTDTYRKVQSGQDVRGYFGLVDYLPESAVAYVDERLQRVRQSTTPAPVITFGGKPIERPDRVSGADLVRDLEPEPVPDICFQGWLGRYVDMMQPLTEAPDAFHIAAAMSLAGATFGRRVGAKYISKATYPNQYIMLIGVAGDSRKDTAIEFALDLPSRRGPMGAPHRPFEIATDIGSAEGLISILSKAANTMLYITEYERLSQNAKRKSTSTIIPTLTAAWNAPKVLQTGTREETSLQARLPTLSVIAAVQPEILTNEMTANEMNSGYASRWLFVPGKSDRILPDPPDIDERDAYNLYLEMSRLADEYGKNDEGGTVLSLTDDAAERWRGWYTDDRTRKESMSELENAVASRLAVHIRKVALLYAALEGASEIDLRHLEPGIAFVEWSWSHTQQLMKTWGSSFWTQIEERILAVLKARGPMKRRDLTNHCRNRKWGSREFAQVLDAMVKNGTVAVDPEGHHALAA